ILHAQGRVSVDTLSTFGRQTRPFGAKENRLFWRGRDSNRARLTLVRQSFDTPALYNVSITNFFFFRDEMHLYVPGDPDNTTSRYVPFVEFFHHRFQINIDGTVAAYRFPFLLAANSLVIKQ